MNDDALLEDKLEPRLLALVREKTTRALSVIVQTVDGLQDDDRNILRSLGGRLKDDLHIINAYSAELDVSAIESLVLSPRVTRIWFDAPLSGFGG